MALKGRVWKFGDNISTDHIVPGRLMYLRSTLPELAKHVLEDADPGFAEKVAIGDFVVGGKNFGLGSSREHAALAPMYLGVKAVIVTSFARIHLANLINFGIVPFTFKSSDDFEKINQGDLLILTNIKEKLQKSEPILAVNKTQNMEIELDYNLTDRQKQIIFAGGLLNFTKAQS